MMSQFFILFLGRLRLWLFGDSSGMRSYNAANVSTFFVYLFCACTRLDLFVHPCDSSYHDRCVKYSHFLTIKECLIIYCYSYTRIEFANAARLASLLPLIHICSHKVWCVYVYIYIYLNIYIYIYMYLCMSESIYIYIYMNVYKWTR